MKGTPHDGLGQISRLMFHIRFSDFTTTICAGAPVISAGDSFSRLLVRNVAPPHEGHLKENSPSTTHQIEN
jgi:hypothetical protein